MDERGQQPKWRTTWSTVQVGLLSIAVVFCIVMLVLGAGQLAPVYRVAVVFFGIALAGHVTFLVITRRQSR